jgi:ATP-binding cassette subfamily B protein
MPNKKAKRGPRLSFKAMMKNLRRLLGYLWKYYPLQFVLVLVAILLSTLANAIGSLYMGQITDFIAGNKVTFLPIVDLINGANGVTYSAIGDADWFRILGEMTAMMAVIYFLGAASNYAYQRMTAVMSQGVQKRIRDALFEKMENLPLSYFDSRVHGDIMSVYTNDIDSLREMLSRAVPMIVSSLATMTVVLIVMFIQSWLLTLVVLGFFAINLIVMGYVTKQSAKFFIAQQRALAKADGYIEELTTGQKVIKVFNHEKETLDGFVDFNNKLYDNSLKTNAYASVLMPITTTFFPLLKSVAY